MNRYDDHSSCIGHTIFTPNTFKLINAIYASWIERTIEVVVGLLELERNYTSVVIT
jgi:hypothetical protein